MSFSPKAFSKATPLSFPWREDISLGTSNVCRFPKSSIWSKFVHLVLIPTGKTIATTVITMKYYSSTYLALCQADENINQNMSHPLTQYLELRNRGLKAMGARIIRTWVSMMLRPWTAHTPVENMETAVSMTSPRNDFPMSLYLPKLDSTFRIDVSLSHIHTQNTHLFLTLNL